MWAGHAWRKKDLFIIAVIKEDPIGKRRLGRPRLQRKYRIKKDIKAVEQSIQWKEVAEDR